MKNSNKINDNIFNIQSAPAFVLLLISTITILIIKNINFNIYVNFALALLVLIAAIIVFLKKYNTAAFILMSISIGLSFFIFNNNQFTPIPEKIIPTEEAVAGGKIIKVLKYDNNYSRYLVYGFIKNKTLRRLDNERFILNLSGPKKYNLGESILANCSIRVAEPKQLPTEFDELKYCRGLGTIWIAKTNSNNIKLTKDANWFYSIRNYTYNQILYKINTLFSPTTASIASALILADRSNMNYEIKEIFAITGIAHILALSGLHIGIIAYLINLFISFITNNIKIKFILFTTAILAFLFLTNAPDSAVRAGFMGILYMYSKIIQRKANPLNIVSLVIILSFLLHPNRIHSLGFILSSSSVLSIVLFYNIINNFIINIFHKNNKIIDSISLTISVSIITAPITAYYFEIFSIISPLTNFIIVPLASLGLICIIITLLLSWIPFISVIFAGSVEFVFRICINIIKLISSFNLIAFTGKAVFLPTLIFSFILIYFFTSKQSKQLIYRLSIIAIFSLELILFFYNDLFYNESNKPQIFAKPNYTLVSIPYNEKNVKKFFLCIFDRRPDLLYYKDFQLAKYINENNIKYIGTTGSFSNTFVDDIRNIINEKQISIRNLNFEEQRYIEKRYLNKRFAVQFINTNSN